MSDEQLACKAQAGAVACFEELARRYQMPLMRYILRSLRQADAEDVVQDAFVQAWLNLARFDPKYCFKTWLFVIAQRLMIDRLRRTRKVVELDDNRPTSTATPVDLAANAERAERLWDIAKRELGEEVYQAMWLHYVEEMSTSQIAGVLDRSWVWVKTALHRARKKLSPQVRSLADVDSVSKAGAQWQTT